MKLLELPLAQCPADDRPLLQYYRRIVRQCQTSRRVNYHLEDVCNSVEAYFAKRLPIPRLQLPDFLTRYAEDFDGVALNAAYSKAELECLRQMILKRGDVIRHLAEDKADSNAVAFSRATDRSLNSSTLGRILAAVALPPPAPDNLWSQL